jgi:exo-beta-1,3-glucanase (GH17 family)
MLLERNASRIGKRVLFKEVGCPTRGDIMNRRTQKDFFRYMEQTRVKFVYFEAFDQFWKNDTSVEPHWGLFDRSRKPKTFILERMKERNAVSKPR